MKEDRDLSMPVARKYPEAWDSCLTKDPTHALCCVEVKTRFGPDWEKK